MIYLDYGATSKKREYIIKRIMEDFDSFNGNPDSQHTYGRKAKRILEEAREKIAKSINASPTQIVFTSGASEANNTVINAFAEGHIVSSRIEHPSILNSIKERSKNYTLVKPEKDGRIDISNLDNAINPDTSLISLIYVNNEIGSINPIEEVGKLAFEKNIWYHLDAVQAYGHLDIDLEELKCDSMSLSGHKIGGLNGFGVLYIRNPIKGLIFGGNQEKKRRAGTSFVAGAYSMGESFGEMLKERDHIKELKKTFIEELDAKEVPYEINGSLEESSDHILNIYLPFAKSDFLLTYLDMNGVCASAGSACTAGSLEASYVVAEVHDQDRADHSIRFSFGFDNTIDDVKKTVAILQGLERRKK